MNKQEMQRCKIKSSGDGSQGQLMRITHDIVILLEFLILFFYRFIFLNPTEGDEGATLQFLLIKEERGGNCVVSGSLRTANMSCSALQQDKPRSAVTGSSEEAAHFASNM